MGETGRDLPDPLCRIESCSNLAGAYAVWKNKVRHYERFATLAFLGCCLQVLFAFASKFNLVCFLFRLTAYVYAKFFRNYLRSLSIVQREHV